MSEARNPFEVGPVAENPYAITPAVGVSLAEAQRHDSGNAIAANAEARVIAEVKAQVLMARQFPRDPRMCMDRILRECERPTLAEKATYTFPRGKETVSGPSIRLAEVLARNWGNCAAGLEVLERKSGTGAVPGRSVMRAYAWDLETNAYIARQFETEHVRETQSGGYKLTGDRDLYEIEANKGARRLRTCILQMIPGDVTQAAVDKCRWVLAQGIAPDMADQKKRPELIQKTVAVFEKMGVSRADLEDYLSAKCVAWTADHMLRLKEIKNGLDDGILSIGEIFPRLATGGPNDKITREQSEALMALIGQTGRQGDVSKALKEMGIAKAADTPAHKLEEVTAMISKMLPAKPAEKPPVTTIDPAAAKVPLPFA